MKKALKNEIPSLRTDSRNVKTPKKFELNMIPQSKNKIVSVS